MKTRILYGYCVRCMCCGHVHPANEECGNTPRKTNIKLNLNKKKEHAVIPDDMILS